MKRTLFFCCALLLSRLLPAQMYIAVLSKGRAGAVQAHSIYNTFPEEKITAYRKDGFFIDDLSFGAEVWTLTASDKIGYSDQHVLVGEAFPDAEIKNYENEGFFVSNICYGKENGLRIWVVVVSKGLPVSKQLILDGEEFPMDAVHEKLLEDYRIIDIAVGQGMCKVVMAKGKGLKYISQEVLVSNEYPDQFITDKTRKEFPSYLTHLSYQDNKWYAVATFGTSFDSQYYLVQAAMPEGSIEQGREEGYLLTQFQKFSYKREGVFNEVPAYLKDYKGRSNCGEIMAEKSFKKLANQVLSVTQEDLEGDNLRLQAIQEFMTAEKVCLTTQQLFFLIEKIHYDETRFDLLELIYPYTYDTDNMGAFEDALGSNEELKKKFRKMLKQ